MKNTKFVKIRLGDVWPNPYRNIDEYDLDQHKVDALMESIETTGFWNNVVGRMTDGYFELAYGHHRLEAAKRVLGEDYEHQFAVADLPDYQMLKIMANENRDDWGNSTKHNNLTVEQGRDFLDHLLDQYPTWEEATRSSEFGGPGNLRAWFGDGQSPDGGAEAGKAAYAKCVKNGVGIGVLVNFFNWKKTDVEYALRQIDPSDKQLAKLKAEEEAAAEALRKAEAEHKAKAKSLKEGVVDAELVKARAKKEKLDKQLAGYDSEAGKLFAKPIHADAFKQTVTTPMFRKYLPESKQVDFAKKLIKTFEKNEDNMTAKAIKDEAWSLMSKANKQFRDAEEKANPWDALEGKVRQAANYASSLDNQMKELIAAVNKAEIKALSGENAERLNKNLESMLSRVALFYDIFGMEPPMLEVVKSTEGKTKNLRVV